jgi:hypothetical protein
MNPPYSDLHPWCAKAYEYAKAGGTVIALLPAWTDAPWFNDFVSLAGSHSFAENSHTSAGGAMGHSPVSSWNGTRRR